MAKWINCKNCNHKYFSDLPCCPECSTKTPPSFAKIIGFGALAAVCLFSLSGIVIGFIDKGPAVPTNDDSSLTVSVDKDDIASKLEDFKEDITASENGSSEDESSSSSPTSSPSKVSQPSSSQSSTPENNTTVLTPSYPKLEKTDPDGAVTYKNGIVYITYPDYMTYMLFEDKDVVLPSEMKLAGFTKAYKNADGSCTLEIPPDRYLTYCDYLRQSCTKVLVETAKSEDITGLEHTQDFSKISFTFNYSELTDEDIQGGVVVGLLITELQIVDIDLRVGCTIEFNHLGVTEPYLLKFPELFITTYNQQVSQ